MLTDSAQHESDDAGSMWYMEPVNAETIALMLPERFRKPLPHLLDASLKGVSQVVFVNNSLSGALMVLAIFIGDEHGPWM